MYIHPCVQGKSDLCIKQILRVRKLNLTFDLKIKVKLLTKWGKLGQSYVCIR